MIALESLELKINDVKLVVVLQAYNPGTPAAWG
jgi:hypothetical protein